MQDINIWRIKSVREFFETYDYMENSYKIKLNEEDVQVSIPNLINYIESQDLNYQEGLLDRLKFNYRIYKHTNGLIGKLLNEYANRCINVG